MRLLLILLALVALQDDRGWYTVTSGGENIYHVEVGETSNPACGAQRGDCTFVTEHCLYKAYFDHVYFDGFELTFPDNEKCEATLYD